MHKDVTTNPLYGLMASFDGPDALMAAATRAREAGFTRVDAFTPFPVEGLEEAIGRPHTKLPMIVFAGGLLGGLTGFGMQYFMEVIDYPKNIGGRPTFSWPAFVPATFEMTVLLAAFAAVIGMLVLNGLPQPYHPVFNVPQFRQASRNGFFLLIESADPKFDADQTREFLAGTNAGGVYDVER
jgi:hypothetical protein